MMADRAKAFRDCLNLPQRLISPCEHLMQRFVTYGADAERMVVIRNVAGIERLRGIARSRADTPPVFGYIGTLYPHKGAHVLVEAANGMAPGAARFVIAGQGDPSYTARLRGHANNPGIEFVGELPREQVVSFYERIDALVVPSICRESGPLVVQEAIAARRAVIGSDLGGIPEQVTHDQNALLFPPGDARALRSLLERVCREPGQLQALAARLPPPHDPSGYVAEHERLYEQVIRERRP
jgi:glycosyltransferase involved in cell wall biosynthesis